MPASSQTSTDARLTGWITVWYRNCSAHSRKSLQRVVEVAQHIIGNCLPAIQNIFYQPMMLCGHRRHIASLRTTASQHADCSPCYCMADDTGAGLLTYNPYFPHHVCLPAVCTFCCLNKDALSTWLLLLSHTNSPLMYVHSAIFWCIYLSHTIRLYTFSHSFFLSHLCNTVG